MKCKYCGHELKENLVKIPKLKIEVQEKVHSFNTSFENLEIPKGMRLLTYIECVEIHNDLKLRKKLGFGDIWIHIEQSFKLNKKKGLVARFYADSDYCDLYCDGDSVNSYSDLGVLFCRDCSQVKN